MVLFDGEQLAAGAALHPSKLAILAGRCKNPDKSIGIPRTA